MVYDPEITKLLLTSVAGIHLYLLERRGNIVSGVLSI